MLLRRSPLCTPQAVTRSCSLLLRRVAPSGMKVRATMALGLPCMVRRHCPPAALNPNSHSLTAPVTSPLASRWPSGLKASAQTQLLCSCKVWRQRPLLTSHHLMVVSALPLNRERPSGLKASAQISPSCPCKIRRHCPLRNSHSLIVLSGELCAKIRPSGRNASSNVAPACLDKTRRHCPLCASHTLTLPLCSTLTTIPPSELNASALPMREYPPRVTRPSPP